MLSYVKDGKLLKVTGDPKHGFTQGHLCAKGYAYTQYVYNPLRIKYPIYQSSRGSGNWKRITWNEAYAIIAQKILELNDRYGSNLACGYNKFSGNLGLLHYAVEGMFNSIGPHTKSYGNLCSSTGEEAIKSSLGQIVSPRPEDMARAKLIVIWGANPAVTNIHQMKFIYKARRSGGKLVVIDPIYSVTAAKADLYVQITPGSDAFLAFGIAKLLIEKGIWDESSMKDETIGWANYKNFLQNRIDLNTICEKTGISIDVLEKLANLYATMKPLATWNGFGIQRNEFGGLSIKAIASLSAISGNLHLENGGVYYANDDLNAFPLTLLNFPEKKHPIIRKSRSINSLNFALEAKNLSDPPLKFLWIASRSPLSQDQHIKEWKNLFRQLELIVTVDLYMTETGKYSDIILPAASHFEEEDLNVSYWHHWLSINQKTIPPYFEAKSDLHIARELTRKLNELSPDFSSFPSDLKPTDWINAEISEEIKSLYNIGSYQDLIKGPKQRKMQNAQINNENQKFTFLDLNEIDLLSINVSNLDREENRQYPYQLLSPQSLLKIHSQFSEVTWLYPEPEETIVELTDIVAKDKNIHEGMRVKIFNQFGSIIASVKINPFLPRNVILVKQTGKNSINQLIGYFVDKHDIKSGPFYDSYVDITKI